MRAYGRRGRWRRKRKEATVAREKQARGSFVYVCRHSLAGVFTATAHSTESLIPNPFEQTYDTLYYDNALWNDLEQKRLTDGVNASMHIVQNE